MLELLNCLYVMTQGSYLQLDHDTVRITVDGETRLRAPLVRLGGIVMMGNVSISPFLVHRCAEDGRSLVWLTRSGRFKARVEGPTRGNVLLRRAQHEVFDVPLWPARLARQFVAAKIQNSRLLLLRAARERTGDPGEAEALSHAASDLTVFLGALGNLENLDYIRGLEGEAARCYFGAFGHMLRSGADDFPLATRNRRPPRDRVNALLSFLYALVRGECASALEGVGLDPQVGYLHALRPGRPALALDLMEELRPIVADRLAVALINRRQLNASDFERTDGGGINLTESGRKTVIQAFQGRKEREIEHRLLRRRIPLGLVPHIQARVLARHLRGELAHYPPYLAR